MSSPPSGSYEVAVIGTGLATLVAAHRLLTQGKRVLVLNPDSDFFLEDSELPLDPVWPVSPDKDSASVNLKRTPGRLKRSSPEEILQVLSPEFPGALELWPMKPGKGFHDPLAPHVRVRSRLWVSQNERDRDYSWDLMDELYVEASDAGLNPQILEGMQVSARFPGVSTPSEGSRGLLIPKICDVDVVRYRNGLLEFLRERLDLDQILCGVSQTDLVPEGVKFHHAGQSKNARISEGVLVFWTPQLSSWISAQARKKEIALTPPTGARLWEQWSLVSRDQLDPSVVGVFRDMAVWADCEGEPSADSRILSVLRAVETGQGLASSASLGSVSELCHNYMKWDRFSIRSMKTRAVLEWDQKKITEFPLGDGRSAYVIPGADGAITEVVRNARNSCDSLLEKKR